MRERVVAKERFFPAPVRSFSLTLCLGIYCFVSRPVTRRRHYSQFNHSRFVGNISSELVAPRDFPTHPTSHWFRVFLT